MKKVVIVGGGVAGLTAGIYIASRGVCCTVIDKNREGVGAMCGWRRNGYEIDGCLHWLTGTKEGTPLFDVWQKTGMLDGGIVKTKAFFTSVTDGKVLSFGRDAEETKEAAISLYPDDEREIMKYFRAVAAASVLSGTEDDPAMSRAEALLTLSPYALLNCGELSERFKSRGMRRALCDLTGREYSALGLIFAYAAYSRGNGYLPRGGSRGAAERMRERFLSLGGVLLSGRRAVKIKNCGAGVAVILSDGDVVTGDRAICCTDPFFAASSFFDESLLPKRFSKKLEMPEKYPLFSSVHVALAARTEDVPFRGTVCFPCRRQDVSSVNRDRMMLREFSHEPTFAPDGMSVLQTMAFTDAKTSLRWISMRKTEEYAVAKRAAADEVKERIAEQYPSLSNAKVLDVWTPSTFERNLSSIAGAYMSFALTPATRPASFPTRLRGAERVYFASMWTKSPGGVPNAASAGVAAAEAVTAAF